MWKILGPQPRYSGWENGSESLIPTVSAGNNKFAYFFSRSAEQFIDCYKFEKIILPGNAVFLHDIFYVFVFTAESFNFGIKQYVFFKRYVQQQKIF